MKVAEMLRWDEIIELVRCQITKAALDSSQAGDCMQKIMEMSIKNRESLDLEPQLSSSHSSSLSLDHSKHSSRNKLKSIKAAR